MTKCNLYNISCRAKTEKPCMANAPINRLESHILSHTCSHALFLQPNEPFILCCLMTHLQQCREYVLWNCLIIVWVPTARLMSIVNIKFKHEVAERIQHHEFTKWHFFQSLSHKKLWIKMSMCFMSVFFKQH